MTTGMTIVLGMLILASPALVMMVRDLRKSHRLYAEIRGMAGQRGGQRQVASRPDDPLPPPPQVPDK